jgi:hypothetical protein
MICNTNIHVHASDPIGFESSEDGKRVWLRIGQPGASTVIHVEDYPTACALMDAFSGLAHVINPTNVVEPENTYNYG